MLQGFHLFSYFNSRPHGGRRYISKHVYPPSYISTHALTEGDVRSHPNFPVRHISTHALTEGDI